MSSTDGVNFSGFTPFLFVGCPGELELLVVNPTNPSAQVQEGIPAVTFVTIDRQPEIQTLHLNGRSTFLQLCRLQSTD